MSAAAKSAGISKRTAYVPPRVYVRSLGAAAQLVMDGTCAIGMLPFVISDLTSLKTFPMLTTDLVPVVAPDHPLAAIEGAIAAEMCTGMCSSC